MGRRVLAVEQLQLRAVVPEIFGRHLLQVGNWGRGLRLLSASTMRHRAVIGNCRDASTQAWVELERLPLASHSVDAILLPHTLEFVGSPHRLLREVDRVLTARGKLLVLGFNPWSPWGVRELCGLHHRTYPTGGRLRRVGRLCDWLTLLDFDPGDVRHFGVSVPWLSRFPRMPFLAGYMVVAEKRVLPMTPRKSLATARAKPVVGASIPVSRIRA